MNDTMIMGRNNKDCKVCFALFSFLTTPLLGLIVGAALISL
jgi:hypothetical protein